MKFYRIHLSYEGGISQGYAWRTTRRQAETVAEEHKANDHFADAEAKVEEIDIAPTKEDILAALQRYANHPDNG